MGFAGIVAVISPIIPKGIKAEIIFLSKAEWDDKPTGSSPRTSTANTLRKDFAVGQLNQCHLPRLRKGLQAVFHVALINYIWVLISS